MKSLLLLLLLFVTASPGATRLFLRATTPSNPPTSGEKSTALPVGTANACSSFATERGLSTSKGSSQTSITCNSLAQTGDQDPNFSRFTSAALEAQTISANTWTIAVATAEGNGSANAFTIASIYVWRPSNSSVVGFIYDSHTSLGIEWGGTEDGQVLSAAGAAVTASANDVLVFELWWHAAQAMAVAYTNTLYFDGTTDVVDATTTDAASYIETPQTLTFVTSYVPKRQTIMIALLEFFHLASIIIWGTA